MAQDSVEDKDRLEEFYQKPDPWDYQTNPDDQERKQRIVSLLEGYGVYRRALDIGAGEGWITSSLPAKEIFGIEISDTAANRFPANVRRAHEPDGLYDLVITTGTLYRHYDYKQIVDWLKNHSCGDILIAGIKEWLINTDGFGEPITIHEFKYRDYTQQIRMYRCE